MLDLLLAGLVGLTYTCLQTLFFLNCLNSRRREQRRLEKVCRESLRKISSNVGEAMKNRDEAEKKNTARSLKENGSCDKVENGGEEDDDKNTVAGNVEDRLVTRLVVKSGKTALPTSQELLPSSHGVQVPNTVVQLDDQTVEDEHDLADALNDPPSQRKSEVNLTADTTSCSTLTMATAAPQPLSEYNITVNSNMIEVRDDPHPPLQHIDPIYESIDGEPNSILTQVTTVCEDADGCHDSVMRNAQELQEQQESEPDIDEDCSTEDEEEEDETYQKVSRPSDINLVSTISRILHSPPESMEPGSENLLLEALDVTSGFSSTHNDASVSVQTYSSLSEDAECRESRAAVGREDLIKDESVNQHGESSAGAQCDAKDLNRIFPSQRATGSTHGTWTLPRATRRTHETHGSLPRPRGRIFIVQEEDRSASSGHTDPPSPAAGHLTRRDEAAVEGDPDQANTLNTCHSTPAMAGAATTPPHTAHCTTTTTTDDHYSEIHSEVVCSLADNSDSSMGNLESTCDPSENHIYSEASGDSLYYTASDRTSCDVSRELRGDSDEGFETTVYELIESPNTQNKVNPSSVIIKLTVSNQSETASKDASDLQEDDVESTLYNYGSNIYEEIKSDSETSGEPISKIALESLDDAYSVSSGSQYENISESDTHGDSGYESPGTVSVFFVSNVSWL